jgi:hypothetical protein
MKRQLTARFPLLCLLFLLLGTTSLYAQPGIEALESKEIDPSDENYLQDFDAFFMPGLGYRVYTPKNDTLGLFHGLSVEFLFFERIRQTNSRGPSHSRMYGKLSILSSNEEDVNDLFEYGVGLDFSIERNPKRDWLIPYFGAEVGAISQKNQSTVFLFKPMLGLHLLAKEHLFINAQGGYLYPVKKFDDLQGLMGELTLNFSLW